MSERLRELLADVRKENADLRQEARELEMARARHERAANDLKARLEKTQGALTAWGAMRSHPECRACLRLEESLPPVLVER